MYSLNGSVIDELYCGNQARRHDEKKRTRREDVLGCWTIALIVFSRAIRRDRHREEWEHASGPCREPREIR